MEKKSGRKNKKGEKYNKFNVKIISEITRRKISRALRGRIPKNLILLHSPEMRKRAALGISKSKKGKVPFIPLTDEQKELRRIRMLGDNNIAKRPEVRIKLSGKNNHRWKGGLPKCIECNKQLSNYYAIRCQSHAISHRQRGENNPAWKGGISSLRDQIYRQPRHKKLLADVKKRDNYTCQLCDTRGGDLETNHIKRFSVIIKQYGIETVEDALNCSELWDINNLITLCVNCHRSIHNKEEESEFLFKAINAGIISST